MVCPISGLPAAAFMGLHFDCHGFGHESQRWEAVQTGGTQAPPNADEPAGAAPAINRPLGD